MPSKVHSWRIYCNRPH